jgi:hypothetical protein
MTGKRKQAKLLQQKGGEDFFLEDEMMQREIEREKGGT